MTIKGLIFDFDGLILDTETPEYQVLQEMFQSYGADLPLTEWSAALGSSLASFNPWHYLEARVGRPLDQDHLNQSWRIKSLALIHQQPPLPGIVSLIRQARQHGLKLGVASSSPGNWVLSLLSHLGMVDSFDVILTSDDVIHVKPDPEIYLKAADTLDLDPSEAIALEDSPNGITAALRAGMFCVAVLNPITRQLNTSHASVVFNSLEGVTLDLLLEKTDHHS
jgi:HAD superfamily hydrolase (TIGR01509 family)